MKSKQTPSAQDRRPSSKGSKKEPGRRGAPKWKGVRSHRVSRLIVVVLVIVVAAVAGKQAWDSVRTSTTSAGEPLDPATFAVGSCTAYSPTRGNRGETVFLDAGHGGVDPGGVGVTQSGKTTYESIETLPVELDVMGLLRSEGYRVVVSRTSASTVLRLGPQDVSGGELTLRGAHDDVAARDTCANDARAQVMVGIYYNAGGSPQDAGCITAYDPDRPFSAADLELADLVQSEVLARMNAQGWAIPNNGVQPDSGLGSLNGSPASGGIAGEAAAYHHLMLIGPASAGFFSTPSRMPGVVIEPLYITDPFEGSIADSQSGQMAIAGGIASAVRHYLAPHTSAAD